MDEVVAIPDLGLSNVRFDEQDAGVGKMGRPKQHSQSRCTLSKHEWDLRRLLNQSLIDQRHNSCSVTNQVVY